MDKILQQVLEVLKWITQGSGWMIALKIGIILFVWDSVFGIIPDRWLPYIGAVRRLARKTYDVYKQVKSK